MLIKVFYRSLLARAVRFAYAAAFAALLILLCNSVSLAGVNSEETDTDPDKILAEDVLIELPVATSDDSRSQGWTGGVPIIVVLPFAADAASPDVSVALAYGCAAGIIDNIYPLSAVRTIPLDRLIRAAGRDVIISGQLGSAMTTESAQLIAAAIGANYLVTGDAVFTGSNLDLTAAVFDSLGNEVGRSRIAGSQSSFPGLLSRLSYDILKICNVALTNDERSYLDYTEPYGFDAWTKCHYGLSAVTLLLSGFDVDKKEIESARRSLTDALKSAPEYLRAREALGILEYITNNPKESERQFRDIVSKYPKHAPARYYLGVISYNRGDFSDAKQLLTIASELNKYDSLAWLYLGRTHLAVKQPVMAEQALVESLKIDPTNPDTFFALGLAQIAQDDYYNAAAAFSEVVMRRPAMPEAHYNLAISFYYIDEDELAIKHFRNYVELTPDDPSADHANVQTIIESILNKIPAESSKDVETEKTEGEVVEANATS